MKIFLITTACLLALSLSAIGQTGFAFEQYTYANTQSGIGSLRPMRVQADKYQNTYVLGYYEQTAIFSQTVGISGPGQQLYLAKFDPQGNAIWARTVAGTRRWDRRGTEVAALFVDADGHSYVSLLLDSGRFVADRVIAVPAGQRVATVTKYNALGDVYFTRLVASGPGISIPDYRPLCADAQGVMFMALTVGSTARITNGPALPYPGGTIPLVVKLANYGGYLGMVRGTEPTTGVPSGRSQGVVCNDSRVYYTGAHEGDLSFTNGASTREITTGTIGASDLFFWAFVLEINKNTLEMTGDTVLENFGTVGGHSNFINVLDIEANPTRGCYVSIVRDRNNQFLQNVTDWKEYRLYNLPFSSGAWSTMVREQYNFVDVSGSGQTLTAQPRYHFDKVKRNADGSLLLRSYADQFFVPDSLLDKVTASSCVTKVSAAGSHMGTLSVDGRVDVAPLQGTNSFGVIGTVGGTSSPSDDAVNLPPFTLSNTELTHQGYLARYAGIAPASTTITSFLPASGRIGDAIRIKGKGFGRIFSLTFNGTKASFTRNTDSTLTAFVPAGAITGPITVYAASGSPISDSAFVILPDSMPSSARLGTESQAKGINLFPNPTTGSVTLAGLDGDKAVLVTDLTGKELLRYAPSANGGLTMDLKALQPGIYMVRQGRRSERLIKL